MDRAARASSADSYATEVVPDTLLALPAFLAPAVSWSELVLRAVVVYAALLIALRAFGKREVGQFTLYDLVFILLVANALQPAITGPDTSLGGGLILILALVGTNFIVSRLDRLPRFHQLFGSAPAVIVKDGQFVPVVMRREGISPDECEMAIREHGIDGVKDVKLGVLEPDGTISIVPNGSVVHRTRHKVRFVRRPG